MKLYILQSLYTSDPYEPSETKVYGVYSSQDQLLDNFVGWIDEQLKTVVQGLRDFREEIVNGKNQHWQEWFKVNADKLAGAFNAYCDKQEEALLEEDVDSIFKKLKEFNVNDLCGQMDHLDCNWFPEHRFIKIFDFMYMDKFFVLEIELNTPAQKLEILSNDEEE